VYIVDIPLEFRVEGRPIHCNSGQGSNKFIH
jgi:hypothetical protein